MENDKFKDDGDVKAKDGKSNICKECGAAFKKPAYLKQHMQSHSLEREALDPTLRTPKCRGCIPSLDWISIRLGDLLRSSFKGPRSRYSSLRPYICTVDGCEASYRRKDHLTRHLLQHQGTKFKCPIKSCSVEFAHLSLVNRHLKEFHDGDTPEDESQKQHVCPEDESQKKHVCPEDECQKKHVCPKDVCQKKHVCPEEGCGKAFRYASQLQKHEESHVKLDSIEAHCTEPGCMKTFTNKQCLKAHIHSCHQYIKCEICGEKKLRKNIKQHLRLKHESEGPLKTIQCTHEGCTNVFSTNSNLRQHIKVVHQGQKPFACCFPGCGMRFGYKHVRDNHEKSGQHVYTDGDFEVADELFRSKPRGGRKRVFPTIEMLVRKRVTPPSELDFTMDEDC